MVLIELTFPGGRYHATPWGRHVNEGAIEWPPSPWRLLRALIAVYWRKRRDLDLATVRSLVDSLASTPPQYVLPDGAGAHTRHYMPLFKGEPKKVFDAFLHIEDGGALQICWPKTELDDAAREALGCLLAGVGYLGRAESWVEARLLSHDAPLPQFNAWIADHPAVEPPEAYERERVLCPMAPADYRSWREIAYAEEKTRKEQERLEAKRQAAMKKGKDPEKEKLSRTDMDKIGNALDALFPESLFDALHADTGELQTQGWSAAPGSRRVVYFRPPIERPRTALRPTRRTERRPTIVRFALKSDTVSADTRPRVENTLYLGEQVRRALMGLSRKVSEEHGDPAPQCAHVFSGKNAEGNPLDDDHAHAFFLPCDDDRDGRIDHVVLFGRDGFTHNDLRAISKLKALWQYGGRPGLLTAYLGEGKPEDFGGFKLRDGQSPYLTESRVWRSVTPYVPTRHPKCNKRGEPRLDAEGNWIDSPEMQLCAELERRGLPPPVHIETYAPGRPAAWRHFATRRKNGGGARAQGAGTGFRIRFAEPVRGPVALGYGCHFGLGLFVAEAPETTSK